MFQSKTNLIRIVPILTLLALLVSAMLTACDDTPARTTDVTPQGDITEAAFGYFLEISKIPRGSGNEQAISDYLAAWAADEGLEVFQDAALNIYLRKSGSKGRENEPGVILQAHMDMVCEKNDGVGHDFLTDPIIPIVDGDFVYADGTTLGADNGLGVSWIMAIFATGNLSHPPLEAIITTDEESSMAGAISFDMGTVTGTRLINVDGESEGLFYVSSAGSIDVSITIPLEWEEIPQGYTSYTVAVRGLTGGHSGVDIDKGFGNANILLALLLRELGDTPFLLCGINGGSANNAIPRECAAVISFADGDIGDVQAKIAEAEETYRSEYPSDPGLTITFEETAALQKTMTSDSTKRVINGIADAPNGIIAMSPAVEGLVQTSSNLGVADTGDTAVTLSILSRSSEPADLTELVAAMRSHAESVSAEVDTANESPAWPYKVESPLRDSMIEIYTSMFGNTPSAEAVHAGLECGVFAEKKPALDMISIGPAITGAHSPDERFSLSSYNRNLEFLLAVLEGI